jgi:predicted DNA-binding protein (MmcQ/YjbR family)
MGDPHRKLTPAEDAVLTRLRRIYEPLGGVVEERDKFGHTAIRVGKQTLAMLGVDNGVPSLGLKSDLTTQAFLVEGGKFYRTPYVGQHGWVSINGTVKQLDWAAIADVLVATYRAVAPKKLRK